MKISIIYLINCTTLFCVVQFCYSCNAQRTYANSGVAVVKTRYFDTMTKQYVRANNDRDNFMWFKDSLVIQEVEHIYQNTDENNNVTWKIVVERYKFIDLRTKEIFEYRTFSDTAKVIKKCTQSDSSCIKECWKFWSEYDFMQIGKVSIMSDTMINGITYKRAKRWIYLISEKGETDESLYAYFRIDKPQGPIAFDNPFSKKIGYPMVKFEVIYTPQVYSNSLAEIEYLPRKLTKHEIDIFTSWERNSKKY
jgi:hypothetical protein